MISPFGHIIIKFKINRINKNLFLKIMTFYLRLLSIYRIFTAVWPFSKRVIICILTTHICCRGRSTTAILSSQPCCCRCNNKKKVLILQNFFKNIRECVNPYTPQWVHRNKSGFCRHMHHRRGGPKARIYFLQYTVKGTPQFHDCRENPSCRS